MSELANRQCAAIGPESRLASSEEAAAMLAQLPGWTAAGGEKIERTFTFETFAQALEFTIAVAAAAEEQGHHPRLTTEWGRTTVTWWTHYLGGLHENDFIMAARTDAIAAAG